MSSNSRADSPPRMPRRGRKGDDPRMIGPWKLGRTIGKGSSGRVRIARHSKTGQYAAVKIVSKTQLVNSRRSLHNLSDETDHILLGIEREIVIMKLIDHPAILRLHDVWETTCELYLVLEYVEGGELFDYICDQGRMPSSEALDYFQQLVGAIDYCHRFNIAHRDLKPENLLLDSKKNLKVADFGMAVWQDSASDLLETSCGSPHYAAPEVVMGQPYDGPSADIWSCGVILFALLAGRLPFDDEDIVTLLEKVKLGKFIMPPDIDEGAKDLLSKMLQRDPKNRISVGGILVHPWYTSQPQRNRDCPPPSFEEIANPVSSASDIDLDILGNLRTLWNGASDDEIVEGLVNDQQTWEKVVYHLLMKYRTSRLEERVKALTSRHSPRRRPEDKSLESSSRPQTPAAMRSRMTTEPSAPSTPPTRPDPPTPRRAGQRYDNSPLTESSTTLDKPPPVPLLPAPLLKPLRLCEKSQQPSNAIGSSPLANELASASPLSPQSLLALSPASPIWEALDMPPLNIEELQDEKVQQFFCQIAEQLGAIQARRGVLSPLSASATPNANPAESSPAGDALSPAAVINVRAPPPIPATDFLGSGIRPVSNGQARGLPTPPDTLGLGISTQSHAQSPRRHSADQPGKENVRARGQLAGIIKKPSVRGRNDEADARPALADKHVQIVLPPKPDRSALHRHTHSLDAAFSPTLSTSEDGSSVSGSGPTSKRSWFANLFKNKPANVQLLSMHDLDATRDECLRILTGLGVKIAVAQLQGVGGVGASHVLKCQLDESRDPAGVMAVTKAVQFRVEVRDTAAAHLAAGYPAYVEMILEKGAQSSFKLVCDRLRRDWELDSSVSPMHNAQRTPGSHDGEDIVYLE